MSHQWNICMQTTATASILHYPKVAGLKIWIKFEVRDDDDQLAHDFAAAIIVLSKMFQRLLHCTPAKSVQCQWTCDQSKHSTCDFTSAGVSNLGTVTGNISTTVAGTASAQVNASLATPITTLATVATLAGQVTTATAATGPKQVIHQILEKYWNTLL